MAPEPMVPSDEPSHELADFTPSMWIAAAGSALVRYNADNGTPPDMASCHTARIEGYMIEGHVPAADMRRLLDERPGAVGLAVPDMPYGSPGMAPADAGATGSSVTKSCLTPPEQVGQHCRAASGAASRLGAASAKGSAWGAARGDPA